MIETLAVLAASSAVPVPLPAASPAPARFRIASVLSDQIRPSSTCRLANIMPCNLMSLSSRVLNVRSMIKFSGAPARISCATVSINSGVVFAVRKASVSVAIPVSRHTATCWLMVAPKACATSTTISAVDAARGSIQFSVPNLRFVT